MRMQCLLKTKNVPMELVHQKKWNVHVRTVRNMRRSIRSWDVGVTMVLLFVVFVVAILGAIWGVWTMLTCNIIADQHRMSFVSVTFILFHYLNVMVWFVCNFMCHGVPLFVSWKFSLCPANLKFASFKSLERGRQAWCVCEEGDRQIFFQGIKQGQSINKYELTLQRQAQSCFAYSYWSVNHSNMAHSGHKCQSHTVLLKIISKIKGRGLSWAPVCTLKIIGPSFLEAWLPRNSNSLPQTSETTLQSQPEISQKANQNQPACEFNK